MTRRHRTPGAALVHSLPLTRWRTPRKCRLYSSVVGQRSCLSATRTSRMPRVVGMRSDLLSTTPTVQTSMSIGQVWGGIDRTCSPGRVGGPKAGGRNNFSAGPAEVRAVLARSCRQLPRLFAYAKPLSSLCHGPLRIAPAPVAPEMCACCPVQSKTILNKLTKVLRHYSPL